MATEVKRLNRSPKLVVVTRLQEVRDCTCGKSGPCGLAIALSCQKNDLGFARGLSDPLGCFNSVELRHSYVEKNYIGKQCWRFFDGFRPIARCYVANYRPGSQFLGGRQTAQNVRSSSTNETLSRYGQSAMKEEMWLCEGSRIVCYAAR